MSSIYDVECVAEGSRQCQHRTASAPCRDNGPESAGNGRENRQMAQCEQGGCCGISCNAFHMATGAPTTLSASSRAATRNSAASLNGAAISCTPTGSAPADTSGTEITGRPMNDSGWVKTPRWP